MSVVCATDKEHFQDRAIVMNRYETSATVEDQGRVQVVGVPFAAGTQVQVTISIRGPSPQEFVAAWRQVCAELRGRPGVQDVTDDDLLEEIKRYRAGQ